MIVECTKCDTKFEYQKKGSGYIRKFCDECVREKNRSIIIRVNKGINIHKQRGQYKTGPSHGNFNKIEKVCKICSKSYQTILYYKEKLTFCSKECYKIHCSNRVSGNRNPKFSGKEQNYPTTFNFKLKEKIRDRDERKCQKCGIAESENGVRLSVHHINYNKKDCSDENLISLCVSCHNKINDNEQTMLYFQEFMKNRRCTLQEKV